MSTRTNWILMLATLAAAAWGFTGCTAHATAGAPEVESVGQLAAGPSVYTQPVHAVTPPPSFEIAGSADDDAGEVATTVTRTADAGEPDAAPVIEGKAAHGF